MRLTVQWSIVRSSTKKFDKINYNGENVLAYFVTASMTTFTPERQMFERHFRYKFIVTLLFVQIMFTSLMISFVAKKITFLLITPKFGVRVNVVLTKWRGRQKRMKV